MVGRLLGSAHVAIIVLATITVGTIFAGGFIQNWELQPDAGWAALSGGLLAGVPAMWALVVLARKPSLALGCAGVVLALLVLVLFWYASAWGTAFSRIHGGSGRSLLTHGLVIATVGLVLMAMMALVTWLRAWLIDRRGGAARDA